MQTIADLASFLMSLTSGTRLGPYEIASAVGAGAMGEVFRARDTKLRRDVAIKVLPDPFAADPDRLARFEREAQVLAALNHPNIAQVYGVEDLPSQGGSPATAALIMEFVDGEDLSQRLSAGAVPIDEALPIAKQIVDAPEAAHEQGIVHRDLAYTCPTDTGAAICAKPADGSGDTRVLVERAAAPMFSPDGRYMVFLTSVRADAGIMLWKLDAPAPRPYIPAVNVSYPVGFSADGRFFAYTSFERSEPRIYVRRFPAGDTQWEVPRVVTEFAIWPAGGKHLFAVIGRNLDIALATIPVVTTGDGLSFGAPRTLFKTTTEFLGAGLVVTPDGTRILTIQHQVTDAPRTGIVVVQNWRTKFSGKHSTQ